MRLLAAMFKHETNTFSPVPTPTERFFGYRPDRVRGQDAIDAHRGTGSGLAGFIAVADSIGASTVTPVFVNGSYTIQAQAGGGGMQPGGGAAPWRLLRRHPGRGHASRYTKSAPLAGPRGGAPGLGPGRAPPRRQRSSTERRWRSHLCG
jgi:hypothetical protein